MKMSTMTRRKFTLLALGAALAIPAGLAGCVAPGNVGSSKPLFDVEVTRTFTIGSYDNKQLLVLDTKVKNNGETSMPASMVGFSYASAAQDGKPLSQGYMPQEIPETLPSNANIAAGGEGQAQIVFELAGTGPVEVTISPETVDSKGSVEVFKQTFDLSAVEKVESESTFDVKIDDVIVTDDGQGKSLVVLAVTFTNEADLPESFSSAVQANLYQNDVQLKNGSLPYNHPARNKDANSNSNVDVKKGASLPVQVVYELLDGSSSIEINMVSRQSFDQRIVLEKTIEVSGAAGDASKTATA